MLKVQSRSRNIVLGLLVFAFVMGGLSMAQQQMGPRSTGPVVGGDTASIGNLFNTGNLGQQKVYSLFSTRTPVTLYGKYGYFYADDQDLVKVKPKYFPEKMKLYFKGIERQLYTLNGASLVSFPDTAGTGGGGSDKLLAFTVREAQTVFDMYGSPYYFKPNDVGVLDLGGGKIKKILHGDDYHMPPIDGIHYDFYIESEGVQESNLCVSFTEEWTHLTGKGVVHANDEDIVCMYFENGGGGGDGFNNAQFEVVFRGHWIGIYDLDAFCYYKERLYLSVKTSVLLNVPPYYNYARDADVICVSWFNAVPPTPLIYIEKVFKGEFAHISTLDALHVWQKEPDPDLD